MINTTLGDMMDFMKTLEKDSHQLVLLDDNEELAEIYEDHAIKQAEGAKEAEQEEEETVEFADEDIKDEKKLKK